MGRLIAFPLVFVAALLLALWLQAAPAIESQAIAGGVVPANLVKTVTEIAAEPHVAGSDAHAKVRDMLIARFAAIGLTAEIQRADGVRQSPRFDKPIAVSPIENLIAVLPGRDPAKPAVAVMAHYDSVRFAPGASDDGAGTAAVLETARLLAAGPKPARDVVFVITDAEEQGLIGAQIFFAHHPLAPHIGIVVNAEARGSRGPATMFQTSPGNAALVDLWARNAIRPSGNSLTDAVYRLLPNDTDMSVSLAAGKPGINAAFIDGQFDYHAPSDSAANLDPGTLLQLGNFVFTTSRALAQANELPGRSSDNIYFDVLQRFVVSYSHMTGWLLLAVALVGLATIRPRRIGTTWRSGSFNAGLVLLLTVAIGAACQLLASALYRGGAIAQREQLAEAPAAFWIGVSLAMGILLLARPPVSAWLGALLLMAACAIAGQVMLPGGSWLFVWPLLAGVLLAHVACRTGLDSAPTRLATIVLGGAVFVVFCQLYAYVHVAIGAMAPGAAALIAPFALVLLGPLVADFTAAGFARRAGALLCGFALAGALWLSLGTGFSPRQPRPGDLFHLTDADRQEAFWGTTSARTELPAGPVQKHAIPGFAGSDLLVTPAPAVPVTAPNMAFSKAGDAAKLVITTRDRPRQFLLAIRPAGPVQGVRVNGEPVTLATGAWNRIRTRADAPIHLEIAFSAAGSGSIDVHYVSAIEGLPAGAPQPAGPPTNWTILSGTRVVTGSKAFDWR